MLQSMEMTGKTDAEAIANALEQLHMDRDEVSVEILERGKSGFLGIGSVPAKVRVTYDDGKEEQPVVQAQPQEKEQPAAAQPPRRIFAEEKLSGRKVASRDAAQPESGKGKEYRERQARPERRERPPRKETQEPVFVPQDLGEEVQNEKAQQIRQFLTGLLEHLDSAAQVKVYQTEEERYKVILEGDKLGQLIGRRGETLDAIQQLTNYCVNRENDKRIRIQVDAENYRAKREDSLNRLAEKVAAKVVRYRHNVTLEPMNAYERHVIHTALQEYDHVTTYSVGTEPNRRVVVAYDRTQAQ